jgi:hypothetical protein
MTRIRGRARHHHDVAIRSAKGSRRLARDGWGDEFGTWRCSVAGDRRRRPLSVDHWLEGWSQRRPAVPPAQRLH